MTPKTERLVMTILVEQETGTDENCFYASYTRANEGGCGDGSATPIGALANLIAVLIKVEEDKIHD